ncbi:MAG TPA: C13 family peptidase [Croceibacterium sp.]|nr:C13 family peptidase [Croceibacterium sp.]
MRRSLAALLTIAALAVPSQAQQPAEPINPPPHFSPWPGLGSGRNEGQVQASLILGPELQRARSAREMLADRRNLDAALAALQPQRRGTIDAYVVSVALDSDPVFSREAREAGKVLARRYGAEGRAITLAGPDGRSAGLAKGSLTSLTLALARIAELMDPAEDVLVLYSTSHGGPLGLSYHDGDTGYGILSPSRLGLVLGELGIKRRIVLLSACYSGVFVPLLGSPDTAIVTAASAQTASFGCLAQNDWTFFGDALVNNALRKPQPLAAASDEARQLIARWEVGNGLEASKPQVVIGAAVEQWLPALEARIPRSATAPVGAPAVNSLRTAGR